MLRIGLISAAGVALGGSVVMTRLGLSSMPVFTLIPLRLLLSTLAFGFTLALLRPPLPRDRRTWRDIALVGLVNTALPLAAFTLSLQYLSSGVLTLFLALIPLFTGILAHLTLAQEKLTGARLIGLALAFTGVAVLLITGTDGLSSGGSRLDPRGPLLALAGGLASAAGAVYTRQRLTQVNVFSLTAGQMAAGTLVLIPFSLAVTPPHLVEISPRGWLAVGYTGLVGSTFAFLIVFQLIRKFGATTSALPTYLMPAVSGVLGAVFLGELITAPLLIGALVIFLGVILAERAALREQPESAQPPPCTP